jgi:hypothetical protein
MTEARLHRTDRDYAIQRGAYLVTQTSPPADSGTPDWLLCYRSIFIGFELKPDGNHPTKIQLRRLHQIILAGGIAAWGNRPELVRALDHVDRYHQGLAVLPAYIDPDTRIT